MDKKICKHSVHFMNNRYFQQTLIKWTWGFEFTIIVMYQFTFKSYPKRARNTNGHTVNPLYLANVTFLT